MSERSFRGVRALPGPLPAGEHVLWQGAPAWPAVFRRIMHGRALMLYFAALLALRAGFVLTDGGSVRDAAVAAAWLLPPVAAALGMLGLLAWLIERTTWYTITNRRVIMRIGIVLDLTCNFPFKLIQQAGLRRYPDGTGDIPLEFAEGAEIAYLHLWPHARPWRFKHTVPMLRCVPEAVSVATLLARAIAAASGGNVVPLREPTPAPAAAARDGTTATAGIAG